MEYLKRRYRECVKHNKKTGSDPQRCPFFEELDSVLFFMKRPVKAFRLLGMDTVEEDIYSHANSKLKICKAVIKSRESQEASESSEIKNLADKSAVPRGNVQQILGQSRDKKWLAEDLEINTEELHRVLQPFLLCRFKDKVEKDLPKKLEVVVYHRMSSLQKKYYKAIRNKDRTSPGHSTLPPSPGKPSSVSTSYEG
ncbi:hypothetical protein Q7C36_006197 [Tachysurus vachellii]|uniref:SNF2 N-terminal domain-containing protein n=1 Tax=Tachysurus vachellii TaxID=175792 RepID=A0AA88NIY8_TACVA|nr:hypothetical protein Q7C36_006197 [Tachysurus vachellii]